MEENRHGHIEGHSDKLLGAVVEGKGVSWLGNWSGMYHKRKNIACVEHQIVLC